MRRPKNFEYIRSRIEELWLEHGNRLRVRMDSRLRDMNPDAAQAVLRQFHDQLFFLLADVGSIFNAPTGEKSGAGEISGQEAFDFEVGPAKHDLIWVPIPNAGDWDLTPELSKTHKREVLKIGKFLLEAVIIVEEKGRPVWIAAGKIEDMDSGRNILRKRRKFKTCEGAKGHFEKIKKIMEKEAYSEQD